MKRLTLENFKELEPYIKEANYNEYNSNIVTMLMWMNRYPVYFACYPHFALVYQQMPHRDPVWLMPYCHPSHRMEAIDQLKEFSTQKGIPFEIHSMVKEFKDWLQETYPNQFLIWDCYDARDYVYDRNQQESLAGKKMQKRRNHFHAFEKLYEQRYEYRKLEKQDIVAIYQFLQEWKAQKDQMDSIDTEEEGIHFLLEHMDQLPLLGGCIYIDGKLEAFNIASRLSNDTIQIHVEKANKQFRGLYIAILKLFLETLEDDILYINREDDMGLAELRKAKTDMQPIKKIQKFGSCHEPLTIRKATKEDEANIKSLWLSSFEDETQISTEYYFQHFYHQEDCYILHSKDDFISMLQLRPMEIMLDGNIESVSFVVGVATNKDYEGCGYMKQLLQYAMKQAKLTQNVMVLQAYHPSIYTSFGFQEVYQQAIYKVDSSAYPQANGNWTTAYETDTLVSLYEAYTSDKNGYRIRTTSYYEELFLKNIELWNQTLLVYEENGIPCGYVVMDDTQAVRNVIEIIYSTPSALNGMLHLLSDTNKKLMVTTDMQTIIQGRKKESRNMMMASLHSTSLPNTSLFINETL